MDEPELPPERLASVFAAFVNQVAAAATTRASPLLAQLSEHLGADLAQLPVTVPPGRAALTWRWNCHCPTQLDAVDS